MKRIGILGGMSPESTVEYYLHITRTYTARFGDYGYPEIIIYSVSFQPYVDWPNAERWDLVGEGLAEGARRLVAAGADLIAIATNTMHLVIDDVQEAVDVPVLSLLDAVGDAILARGLTSVGLLGTRFTMEKPLYHDALAEKGVTVLTPPADDRRVVNGVIYDELVAGVVKRESRAAYLRIIGDLVRAGAEGVILGCTEIPLLVNEEGAGVPLFDSTVIHADAILDVALEE
jgi:aspartate racemase